MFGFIARNLRWLLAGFMLTAFSGFGQTYFISLSNDELIARFDLSHGSLGLIYALATGASALILLEFGRIVDRFSTRTASMIVLAGLAGAIALMAFVANIWMLFVAILGLRLFGQGMTGQVAMTAAGRWFEAKRGRAVSIIALGYPASEALLPPVFVALFAVLSFTQAWLAGAAVTLIIAIPALWVLLREERAPGGFSDDEDGLDAVIEKASWRRGDVLRTLTFPLLLAGVLCTPFMATALFFHQLHLIEVMGWTTGLFAAGFSLFALSKTGSSLLAGALVDRFSARQILPFGLLPLAAGLMLPAMCDGVWVVFAIMLLVGLTAGFEATALNALWPEIYGLKFLGEIRALTFAAMVTSTAVSPFLTGALIDLGIAFPLQLAVMGGYTLLASALLLFIQPRLASIARDETLPPKSSPQVS